MYFTDNKKLQRFEHDMKLVPNFERKEIWEHGDSCHECKNYKSKIVSCMEAHCPYLKRKISSNAVSTRDLVESFLADNAYIPFSHRVIDMLAKYRGNKLFISKWHNRTAIEYIRNAMKRVRKKESSVILASQNIEDFLLPDIKEFTKPLFSIPTHHFLFYPGNINAKDYEEALMVEPNEYQLIRFSSQGTCLYRCGNERYLLQVIAPKYKSALFGKAGGR